MVLCIRTTSTYVLYKISKKKVLTWTRSGATMSCCACLIIVAHFPTLSFFKGKLISDQMGKFHKSPVESNTAIRTEKGCRAPRTGNGTVWCLVWLMPASNSGKSVNIRAPFSVLNCLPKANKVRVVFHFSGYEVENDTISQTGLTDHRNWEKCPLSGHRSTEERTRRIWSCFLPVMQVL